MVMHPQCFIDDSGSDPQDAIFVLGGFVATAANWARFADEWQSALDEPPGLAYFKMSEAERMGGEFDCRKGWTKPLRDSRLSTLADIIKTHAIVRVAASIPNEAFYRLISSLAVPKRKLVTDHPYIMLATQLVMTILTTADVFGINDPIDFIFDEQTGFSVELVASWDLLKDDIRKSARPFLLDRIGSVPTFRNEMDFNPLQAADLYAWQIRRHLIENRVLMMPPSPTLRKLQAIPAVGWDFDERQLKNMRDFLLRTADLFKRQNPGAALIDTPGKKERRAAKQQPPKPSSAQRRKAAFSKGQPS